jgi:hypothetical protein
MSPEPNHNSGYYDDITSKVSHGLPPTGVGASPSRRKTENQRQIPKQLVKPPSNYGKPSRQQSYNRVAPPQKKIVELGGKLNRDKSSDGILNRGQLSQFDNMSQQVPQDQMLQNQAQLQQQLALM